MAWSIQYLKRHCLLQSMIGEAAPLLDNDLGAFGVADVERMNFSFPELAAHRVIVRLHDGRQSVLADADGLAEDVRRDVNGGQKWKFDVIFRRWRLSASEVLRQDEPESDEPLVTSFQRLLRFVPEFGTENEIK